MKTMRKPGTVRRTFTIPAKAYKGLRREAVEARRSAQRQLAEILVQRYGLWDEARRGERLHYVK